MCAKRTLTRCSCSRNPSYPLPVFTVEAGSSILNQPRKQCERRPKPLLLLCGKLLRNNRSEPVLSRGPAVLEPLQTLGRQRHESLPAVARVRSATDQTSFLQRRNNRAHRLRAHPFRPRQARNRGRAIQFEPKKNRSLGWRQIAAAPMLACPQLEPAEHRAHLGGKRRGKPVRRRWLSFTHKTNLSHLQVNCKDYLCTFPVAGLPRPGPPVR